MDWELWRIRPVRESRLYKVNVESYLLDFLQPGLTLNPSFQCANKSQLEAIQSAILNPSRNPFHELAMGSLSDVIFMDVQSMKLYDHDTIYDVSWFGEENIFPDLIWTGVFLKASAFEEVHGMQSMKRLQSMFSYMYNLGVVCFTFHGEEHEGSLHHVNLVLKTFLWESFYHGTITNELPIQPNQK